MDKGCKVNGQMVKHYLTDVDEGKIIYEEALGKV